MTREKRTVSMLVGVVVLMGALSWAAVPFYNWFCKVTGYGGTTQTAEQPSDEMIDEVVRVRFDANTDKNLDWSFRPMQNKMELKIGENALAFYEAINTSDEPITGTASFNVAPRWRAITSSRWNASALPSRHCNPASGSRCRSTSMSIPNWWMTGMRNGCGTSPCPIPSTAPNRNRLRWTSIRLRR